MGNIRKGYLVFLAVLLALAVFAVETAGMPAWQTERGEAILALTLAGVLAERFTIDYPDRRRISISYLFPLIAASIGGASTAALVAGAAGGAAGLLAAPRLRTALFHGPRLAVAATSASYAVQFFFGSTHLEATWRGFLAALGFALSYALFAWALGTVEQHLIGSDAVYPHVDVLTNALLVPVPLALAALYDRAGLVPLVVACLSLSALLIIVRAYVNMATLHGELERAYARLEDHERQLSEALRINKELSQVISHDLRGPLSSVMGFADLLRRSIGQPNVDADRQLRHIDRIQRNCRRILSLVDDLVKIQQVEEAGELLEAQPVQPAKVVAEVVDDLQGSAEERNVELQLDVNPEVPEVVINEWMLHEIVDNLVSNAIKYTPEGGRVRVAVRGDGSGLRLTVEDNGIGIASEDQSRLFTRFFRADKPEVNKVPGTGLGLALARAMVEKLNGDIEVRSELGAGSCFTVKLPEQVPATSRTR